jgi:hypothetical protein
MAVLQLLTSPFLYNYLMFIRRKGVEEVLLSFPLVQRPTVHMYKNLYFTKKKGAAAVAPSSFSCSNIVEPSLPVLFNGLPLLYFQPLPFINVHDAINHIIMNGTVHTPVLMLHSRLIHHFCPTLGT